MPKTKRDNMKRTLASGLFHIDQATERIAFLYNLFKGVHDDYAQLLTLIAQSMEITTQLMRQFWLLAWGKLPDDVSVYRK